MIIAQENWYGMIRKTRQFHKHIWDENSKWVGADIHESYTHLLLECKIGSK